MITAMLAVFAIPFGCYTLAPADARDLADGLGTQVLAMAELQNRRAQVTFWWKQERSQSEGE